jgi:hypothetical protein
MGENYNTCSLQRHIYFCIIKVKYSQSQIGGRNNEEYIRYNRELFEASLRNE